MSGGGRRPVAERGGQNGCGNAAELGGGEGGREAAHV